MALLCLQRIRHNLYWKIKFLKQAIYIRCYSKTIKIYPNQLADFLRFLFTEVSLKIKKGLELVSRSHFSWKFFDKNFSFLILHKLAKFLYQTVFTTQVIRKNVLRASRL